MSTAKTYKPSALAKKGLAMRRRVHPSGHVERVQDASDDFMMMFNDATNEFCWGSIWTRSGLTIKERSALSLAIAASHGQTGAVEMHTKTALKSGWTRKQIGEVFLHVYVYAGVYNSLSAFLAAKEEFEVIEPEEREARASKARASKAGTAKAKGEARLRP